MELAPDTRQLAKYSPTSTPVLDVLRPVESRRRGRISSGEYFFLSSTVILTLIALPMLSRAAAAISPLPNLRAIVTAFVVLPGLALTAAIAVHELGHLLAAWLAGFCFWSSEYSQAARELYSCQGFTLGIIKLEAPESGNLARRLLWVMTGGPAVSLLGPLAAELYAAQAGLQFLSAFCIHAFSAMSVLLGLAELLPDTGKGVFSDGARILMLVRNNAAGQRWLCNLRLQRALSRGQHPRSWDEAEVSCATAIQDDSRDCVTARWLGYLWAVERQDITSSTKYLEEALAAPHSTAAGLRDRLFLEAAVFQAWFREDSEKARFWSGQMRMGKVAPVQQARLEIALLWSEGKLFDAWEKLCGYVSFLRAMSASPARSLAEQSAAEWKAQLESRMLTRAWRAMYSMSQEASQHALQDTLH